jgi:hypothetical protein
MQEIIRKYRHKDEEMLVKAEVMATLLAADMALFTAKFPFINPTFLTSFNGSIDTANAFQLDEAIVSNIKVLTSDVNNKVLEGHEALRVLGIYAELAFMNDAARQGAFGQNTWAAAKSDQEKMMNALEAANRKASEEDYHDALLAKGYSDAEIDNLLTIANALRNLNLLQESAITERPVTTQDRVILYNSVWDEMKILNIASKVVFAGNPAKLEQYMLYPNSTNPTTIRIAVKEKDSSAPLANAIVELTNTELASKTTNEEGNVEFISTTISDLISISIKLSEDADPVLYENESVAPGLVNELELTVPK